MAHRTLSALSAAALVGHRFQSSRGDRYVNALQVEVLSGSGWPAFYAAGLAVLSAFARVRQQPIRPVGPPGRCQTLLLVRWAHPRRGSWSASAHPIRR